LRGMHVFVGFSVNFPPFAFFPDHLNWSFNSKEVPMEVVFQNLFKLFQPKIKF
jgi:hypothetical protein